MLWCFNHAVRWRQVGASASLCHCPEGFTGSKCEVPVAVQGKELSTAVNVMLELRGLN